MAPHREQLPEQPNPLGMQGIEFIEYATMKPQALGQVLERLGFQPIARHRSREVTLYRQAAMSVVVNAHLDDARASATDGGHPVLSAVGFLVHDAAQAHARCVELGAWDVPSHARAMELVIPGIHGPGGAHFYFVERWRGHSIFDVDFVPIPTIDPDPPAVAGTSFFGIVQYIGLDRSAEWMAFYERMFGFTAVPDDQRYGIMPAGTLMNSPCGNFMWQLIEPDSLEVDDGRERMQRVGIGTRDVRASVAALRARGVQFVDSAQLHPDDRGALSQTQLGSVSFELVHQEA